MQFTTTLLATLLVPTTAVAQLFLAGNTWSVTGSSSSQGFNNIYFPISVKGSPAKTGYLFSRHFEIINADGFFEVGLAPRDNGALRAIFNSWDSKSTTNDGNCQYSSSSFPRVSCYTEVVGASYGDNWDLFVSQQGGPGRWIAELVNNSTARAYAVGSFTLPSDRTGIDNSASSYVEYLPFTQSNPNCSALPIGVTTWGTPYTDLSGLKFSQNAATEGGACKGKQGFKTSGTSTVKIQTGFSQ